MRWVTTLNKLSPQAIQDMLDELAASRASRKRAWENLQEIRWVIKDMTGTGLPLGCSENDRPGGQDRERRGAERYGIGSSPLADLVHAIKEYRKLAENTPLTLQGSPYSHAVLGLNKAIERADGALQW